MNGESGGDDTAQERPDDGGAVLLNDTDVDPEVADAAAEAVRREWRRRHWTRRRDVDYGDRG